MEQVVIVANRRDMIGKQVRNLRRSGMLPAVIYGTGVEPTAIMLDQKEASRQLRGLPASALVTVELDGTRHMVLIREKQMNPLLGTLRHVDFQVVSMKQKLRVPVRIHMVGEAPAVEEFDAVVVTNLEALEVESLPGDLPESLEVDISVLKEIGDAVYVRDLTAPPNVTILEDPETMLVSVSYAMAEIEEEPAEGAEEELAEPEVIERGKKEEEEEE